MPTKRSIKKRLEHLEATAKTELSADATASSDEEQARINAHIPGLFESLDDEQHAELEQIVRRIDKESGDAETGPSGLTEAECAYLNVLF